MEYNLLSYEMKKSEEALKKLSLIRIQMMVNARELLNSETNAVQYAKATARMQLLTETYNRMYKIWSEHANKLIYSGGLEEIYK